MTSEPNAEMKSVHDRMPVILHKKDESRWLNEEITDEDIQEMLWTPEDGCLDMFEESKDVIAYEITTVIYYSQLNRVSVSIHTGMR